MAEELSQRYQFEYRTNSNLVLVTDKSLLDKRSKDEPTGEVLPIKDLNEIQMGSKVMRGSIEALKSSKEKKRKKTDEFEKDVVVEPRMKKKKLNYTPSTMQNTAAYEQIVKIVTETLPAAAESAVLDETVDEILIELKRDYSDNERKTNVYDLFGDELTSDNYDKLVRLSNLITDYKQNKSSNNRDQVKDDMDAVKIQFEDDESEDDEDQMQDFVEDSEPEDEEDDMQTMTGQIVMSEEIAGTATEIPGTRTALPVSNTARYGGGSYKMSEKVNPKEIDAFWLKRKLAKCFPDPEESRDKTKEVIKLLNPSNGVDVRGLENKLMKLFRKEHFDVVQLLRNNRVAVYFCTELNCAQSKEERERIESNMKRDPDSRRILEEIKSLEDKKEDAVTVERNRKVTARAAKLQADVIDGGLDDAGCGPTEYGEVEELDLEKMSSNFGSHWITSDQCNLPDGSYRRNRSGYNHIHVPAPRPPPLEPNENLIMITDLPAYCQPAFEGVTKLNRIQSKVCKTALETDENILLCAPTGAGKTNVALLSMLREIEKHISPDGSIRKEEFLMVYVAPMKSLVSEMTAAFGERLRSFGIKVSQLSGDVSLTRRELRETQLVVCTPEKWDVVSVKAGEQGSHAAQRVRLIVLDEIHLLHDERGPVLEALVARTTRAQKLGLGVGSLETRLVGLSATLPNSKDVAAFLRVNPDVGLFQFGASYRPVPLQQDYFGVTEKSAKKRVELMNSLVYDRVMEYAGKQQVLVFVHSRRDTAATAKAIRDRCLAQDTVGVFLRDKNASRVILQQDLDKVKNHDLKDLLPYGFAIHHAGLPYYDRKYVEGLFVDRHIQVLVSTSTLAWGVNLPAHAVIIKGTQVYSPEKGEWTELSALDVMQMFGRAGRPQYDTRGSGSMITSDSELHYYLSLLNEQLPIESQLIRRLPDVLNSELVLGNVRSVMEAVDWLTHSYLYIRMIKNPKLYRVEISSAENEKVAVHQMLKNLAYSAIRVLEGAEMVQFESRSGEISSTELGRIAAHYYCTNQTTRTFVRQLRRGMVDIEVLRVFSECSEFNQLSVRVDEREELKTLLETVPVPVSEPETDVRAKVNCLLQAFISQLKLEKFTLASDASFVSQSAARLVRAMFEFSLSKRWAGLTELLLTLAREIEQRQWACASPLRQFRKTGSSSSHAELVRKLEKKQLPWEELLEYEAIELGELLDSQSKGRQLHRYLHLVPRLELAFRLRPLSRSALHLELSVTADFEWSDKVHGTDAQPFWILVEDVNGERILHAEYFLLKRALHNQQHVLHFQLPLFEPASSFYFVRAISDRWLGSEAELHVNLTKMLLPEKNQPPTELLDLQRLPVQALRNAEYERVYSTSEQQFFFNSIQTQCFDSLYNTDDNVFLGAPTGSGKTVCAELALMRLFSQRPDGRAVYVTAVEETAVIRFREWSKVFGSTGVNGLGKIVVRLSGNAALDGKEVARAHLVIATASQWDVLSRRWKQRRALQHLQLLIADDLHLLGSHSLGATLEIVCSRTRYMASQLDQPVRLLGMSYTLANARDVGEWLDCHATATYNFGGAARPRPMRTELITFNIHHAASRVSAMVRPAYRLIYQHQQQMQQQQQEISAPPLAPVIIFAPTMKATEEIVFALITLTSSNRFFGSENLASKLQEHSNIIQNEILIESLKTCGIGFIHEALSVAERQLVLKMFAEQSVISLMVVSAPLCWSIPPAAQLVLVLDTQTYHGRDCSYQELPGADLIQMVGRANSLHYPDSRVVVMCHPNRQDWLHRLLVTAEPIPLESQLDGELHDHFNAEVVTKVIETKQDAVDYLTWTFLYYRMTRNPSYYGLRGVSHRYLSDHLSVLVEDTLNELERAHCVSIRGEDRLELAPVNLGMIAAYYYIRHATIDMFARSLRPSAKVRGLLELVCSADEFESLPLRHGEQSALSLLQEQCRWRHKQAAAAAASASERSLQDPKTKASILLQAHLARAPILAAELREDLSGILKTATQLVLAIVDVLSSNRWLRPALAAMELAQMLTQAQWSRDSLLLQIPHIGELCQKKLHKALGAGGDQGAPTVFDLMRLEDSDKLELLSGLTKEQTNEVVKWVARYPNMELRFELVLQQPSSRSSGSVLPRSRVQLQVILEREAENGNGPVLATRLPFRKEEAWWLVVGEPSEDRLVGIKLVPGAAGISPGGGARATPITLQFEAPEQPGTYNYSLYFMSDSYLGCDQEYDFELKVASE